MQPRWFDHKEVPFDCMWPDDYLWYPYLLNKKYFNAFFKFEGITKLLEHSVVEHFSGEQWKKSGLCLYMLNSFVLDEPTNSCDFLPFYNPSI